jgi:hypothetical protein
MATDQVQVIHSHRTYDVMITVTEKIREVVVAKDYRHVIQEASTPQIVTREIESMQFTMDTKGAAIKRAVSHLNIIAGDEE